jgi:membrane-bound serine protease (ClpP class)
MEIFVVPGFGVFGVSGILLVVTSLVMASQTFTGIDMNHDVMTALRSFGTIGISLIAVMLFALTISSYLPHIPLLREMVLVPPGGEAAQGPRLKKELEQLANPLMGETGRALTILRPAGKAQIGSELLDVVSDGPFIAEGRQIKVVQISGNRIVVREVLDT